ncbi:MAG TPA: heme NO-binding domain-containing protein [Anaerolineae bacterium]|nr:heme NO-binding domain-containing protein [Anaerolineae bacterium]
MVGVIPVLLFDFVEKNWGKSAVSEIKLQAGMSDDKEFRLDTYYPDEEWRRIFKATVAVLQMDSEELETVFARYCGEDLVIRFAGFLKGVNSARDVITRQPKIHNFIGSSVQDSEARQAISDKFRLEEKPDETIMHYVSPNQLCTFYRGLAQWVADYFGEKIQIKELHCLKQGAAECEIHVKYLGKKEPRG